MNQARGVSNYFEVHLLAHSSFWSSSGWITVPQVIELIFVPELLLPFLFSPYCCNCSDPKQKAVFEWC